MINILITGGTLDKQYNPLNGSLIFSESVIGVMLQQARITQATQLTTLMLKDSLEMDDDDRATITQACCDTEGQKIIITHGTDTMVDTAKAISTSISCDKVVVLLGAMVPYQFKQSDALFNLGCAFTAVQTLPPGIYITMNGKVFDYRDVAKDRSIGEFVHLT